jgi:hypothetical protein
MYHLAEVRWQQGQREAAAKLVEQSLEIMETQVGVGAAWWHCVCRLNRLQASAPGSVPRWGLANCALPSAGCPSPPIPPHPGLQGVGATPGCVRRRGRLAEMQLELGRLDEAEALLRSILAYVESAQVGLS